MIEDQDCKIVSKEENIWINVKNEAKELIKQSENNLVIQKAVLQLAEQKIKETSI